MASDVIYDTKKVTKPDFLIHLCPKKMDQALPDDNYDKVFRHRYKAAGLMNDFPYLVIRGIYDYADSHKNINPTYYAASTNEYFIRVRNSPRAMKSSGGTLRVNEVVTMIPGSTPKDRRPCTPNLWTKPTEKRMLQALELL
ncbi:hypothetical protein CBS147325_9735 [Penicillium roqueforti]|nr:hypothetical protein CBS147325_9735 [Penicillium roqueforti]KAI3151560.1 hypothetical protein DTO046C5_9179 [Penicillium roqueforti]